MYGSGVSGRVLAECGGSNEADAAVDGESDDDCQVRDGAADGDRDRLHHVAVVFERRRFTGEQPSSHVSTFNARTHNQRQPINRSISQLECGPMPIMMVALPNTGGALCSMPQSLADAEMPCSNAAKTRNPLKFAGVPQTTGWISAVRRPKFTILWGHVEDTSALNKFFSDCRYVP